MSVAFSTTSTETYVVVDEAPGTGHVTLRIDTPIAHLSITVEAGDLARALFTASPAFSTGVGEIVQRSILSVLGGDDDAEASDTIGD